jgi:hypothetical protein
MPKNLNMAPQTTSYQQPFSQQSSQPSILQKKNNFMANVGNNGSPPAVMGTHQTGISSQAFVKRPTQQLTSQQPVNLQKQNVPSLLLGDLQRP